MTGHNLPAHYDIPGLPEPLMNIIFTIAGHNAEGGEEHFYLCNALKYLARYGHKNGTEDLTKAIDYIERIKALHELKQPAQGDMEEFWEER